MKDLLDKLTKANEAKETQFDWNGHKFVVRKYEDEWRAYPEGEDFAKIFVAAATSPQEAQSKALRVLKQKGEAGYRKALEDTIKASKKKDELLSPDTAAKFKSFFKIDIAPYVRDPLLNMVGVYSFDIIKFDHWLRTPEGTSTKDYIKQKYGEEAMKFIEHLNSL